MRYRLSSPFGGTSRRESSSRDAQITPTEGGTMRIHPRSSSIVILAALLALSIACSKKPSGEAESKPSDDAITRDLETRIAADPDTRDSQVAVAAKEGKVTLTGKAKTPVARKKVEQIAQEAPGVAAVDDQIAVEAPAEQAVAQPVAPPPPPPPPPPQPIVVPAGTVLTVR